MEKRQSFTVTTESDFEGFLAVAQPAFINANPQAWQLMKVGFDEIVRLTRAALPYGRPATFYLIDMDDHIIWEEDHHDGVGVILIIQIPKP